MDRAQQQPDQRRRDGPNHRCRRIDSYSQTHAARKRLMLEQVAQLVSWLVPIILLAVIIFPQAVRILREYERGVIFRLGKLSGTKGPGLIFLIPLVDRMVKMDLRVGAI